VIIVVVAAEHLPHQLARESAYQEQKAISDFRNPNDSTPLWPSHLDRLLREGTED
jgi:hypothetical protein